MAYNNLWSGEYKNNNDTWNKRRNMGFQFPNQQYGKNDTLKWSDMDPNAVTLPVIRNEPTRPMDNPMQGYKAPQDIKLPAQPYKAPVKAYPELNKQDFKPMGDRLTLQPLADFPLPPMYDPFGGRGVVLKNPISPPKVPPPRYDIPMRGRYSEPGTFGADPVDILKRKFGGY